MDVDVYLSEKVGDYMNKKFISVKVQMDSSKYDNEQVQKWYVDAKAFQLEYKITELPSFLFFSSDGELVHKAIGYKSIGSFITLASNANNPDKQYYTLLKNYKQGMGSSDKLIYLATNASKLGDRDLANEIIKHYFDKILPQLDDQQLLVKENIDFLTRFPILISTNSRFFNLCYKYPDKIDSIVGRQGVSKIFTYSVISNQEIWSKLFINNKPITNKPDWSNIYSNVSKKYNTQYATLLTNNAKLKFYRLIKDWRLFIVEKNKMLKEFPPKPGGGLEGDAWSLNVDAWDIFLTCDDKEVLRNALKWSELSIQLDSTNIQFYDTKANLLYKLGRVDEAIAWENKAIKMDNDNAKINGSNKGAFFDEYIQVVDKMRKGIPTW
jgi:tetratricopeptide (TPR) repeat protein